MELGVIGSGKIVEEFLPHLARMEEVSVRGLLCTPRSVERAERLAAQNGGPAVVTSLDALCALGIDTVYVAVPNALHYSFCVQALDRGLHVIAEKPLAVSERETADLARLAREKARFLFEAVTTPFLESFARLRAWLPRIGEVRQVLCNFAQYSSRYDAFRAGQTPPVFDPAQAGGALMDLNLYNFTLVLGLFGPPTEVRYTARMERGIDVNGVALLRYPGFTAVCAAAKDSTAPFTGVIQGTEGCLTLDSPPNLMGSVRLRLRDGTEDYAAEPMAACRVVPEFRAFAQAIREKDWAFFDEQMARTLAVSRALDRAKYCIENKSGG